MEVGSETGIMSSREPPFTVNLQKNNSVQSPPSSMQNVRLLFGSDGPAVYKQVPSSSPPPPTSYPATTTATGDDNTGGGGGGGVGGGGVVGGAPQPFAGHSGLNMNMGETVKRKRGRPRKYGPDGSMPFVLSPVPSASAPPSHASLSSGGLKKAKVRPPGSGKKHLLASLGSAGTGFTPHIITVKTGEDVSSKIMSFLQHGPRAVCVLSANGAISNVTLRQATISGGTVTYEGRFEILSLSGSFLLSESGGQRSRTGGLSVSLAGPDGRVLGGGVAGILTAASPVQVVAGSFMVDGGKESKKSASQLDLSYDAKLPPVVAPVRNGSPNSHGTQSESSGGGPGSPFHHSTGGCSNGNQNQQTMPNNIPWK